MLSVKLGKTFDDPIVLEKNVTWIQGESGAKIFQCKPTDNCDILTPGIILGYTSDLAKCNYAYISDFGRYYFVKDPQLLTGGRMLLQLYVDVLYSWASTITNSPGVITRASLSAPTMIPDSQYPLYTSERVIQNAVFSNPNGYFSNAALSSFILTTLAGDYTPPSE